MANLIIPYGPMPPAPPPPLPPDPAAVREQAIADNTRAESELNRFMAAKQDALFNAPDAYYRTQGADAIRTAPFILDGLSRLKEDALDGLANDAQRRKLRTAIDAHLQLARDDIARHVAEQNKAWQRQTALDRITLLTKEAGWVTEEGEHLLVLQEKLNNYLHYIESGQPIEDYPQFRGMPVGIRVRGKYSLSTEATKFYRLAEAKAEELGFSLEFSLAHPPRE